MECSSFFTDAPGQIFENYTIIWLILEKNPGIAFGVPGLIIYNFIDLYKNHKAFAMQKQGGLHPRTGGTNVSSDCGEIWGIRDPCETAENNLDNQ